LKDTTPERRVNGASRLERLLILAAVEVSPRLNAAGRAGDVECTTCGEVERWRSAQRTALSMRLIRGRG
ncbi:unnamed protein product, partial [Lampetra fluviatilis]